MAKDRTMRRVDVAIAVLVLQRSNQHSKVSIVPDKLLEEELGCNRATFTEFRKRGTAAGYFTCIPGHSGQATIYKWKNDRLYEIQNMALDSRVLRQEESLEEDEDEQTDNPVVRRKLSARAAASVRKTKHYGDPVAHIKPSTVSDSSAQKTAHYDNAEKTDHYPSQCEENLADSAKKTKHLHSYNTLKDSLPEESLALTHTREADGLSDQDGWTEEDRQARFDEIAGYLEYDEGLPRDEAEHRARILCGFDDAGAEGRQGGCDAPPTTANQTPEKGYRDDQDDE
jgi:hypothetical protein